MTNQEEVRILKDKAHNQKAARIDASTKNNADDIAPRAKTTA